MSEPKPRHKFLQASEAMLEALDVACGLSAHQLRCFLFNFQQFIQDMIDRAEVEETTRKYPMRRKDWGKTEQPLHDPPKP